MAAALASACAASPPTQPPAIKDESGAAARTPPAAAAAAAAAEPHRTTAAPAAARDPEVPAEPPAPAEASLGVADRGIFADLDAQVQLTLPAGLTAAQVTATIDAAHGLLVLDVDGWPTKAYPLGGDAVLRVGEHELALRPGDRAELAPLLRDGAVRALAGGGGEEPAARGDRDGDGIPDTLDVLIGARKTVLNADAYEGGYVSLDYPGGDVPRTIGVCTDVIVRALRNAGLDLQPEVHRDIRRAPKSYPMVEGDGDASIDHRRVKTILPYFRRHMSARTERLDDAADPLRPGDVVFMDTFPDRPGPDHIGIVSDHRGDDGLPLVINNWTDGTVTAEMDLLGWVPVTHRFRIQ